MMAPIPLAALLVQLIATERADAMADGDAGQVWWLTILLDEAIQKSKETADETDVFQAG